MILILLLFLAALSLEGIGTYISVIGLAATFAADPIILTMAVVLDFCKIIAVNTLAKSWGKLAKTIRGYLIASTLVLSLITSAGVAGYLSNSFQKAMLPNQGNDIALVNIKSEQERLLARKKEIDTQISQLPPNQVRSRQRLMASFKGETDHINDRLNQIDVELPKLQTTQAKIHTDVGSIMYFAKVANIEPEKAVGIIIGLIIFVFDPMAIVFMVAANSLLRKRDEEKEAPEPEPIVIDEGDVKAYEPEENPEPYVDPQEEWPVFDATEETDASIEEPVKPKPLESLEVLEDQPQIIYPVKRLPNIMIDATPKSSTLAVVEPVPEQITAEVVVEEPKTAEQEVIIPEYKPEVVPEPEPIVEEPHFTTDVEVHHVGEPTPMELDEGMKILQDALQPAREALAESQVKSEPHLEDVLAEILRDKNGAMTDEERAKLDRALDRIFATDPNRDASDEPDDEEVEEPQPVNEEVPSGDPVEPVVEEPSNAKSLLHDPQLDQVKGTGVEFVGPVWVNPKLLEIYNTKS